jgi:hypothetical protein
MDRALRDLKIPVGEVVTSPTYRALDAHAKYQPSFPYMV